MIFLFYVNIEDINYIRWREKMYNKQLIKDRKQMIIQQLIYDNICSLRTDSDREHDRNAKIKIEKEIKHLEKLCDDIDFDNVTKMEDADKRTIMELLEVRIRNIETDRVEDTEDPMDKIVDFILYEYKELLKEFIGSISKDE